MKITKLLISAIVPFSLWLSSCDEGIDDAFELGRKVDWPEMSAEERGASNGEILAKALHSICDTVASAKKKELTEDPIFSGMVTSPLSKAQRPYELSVENAKDTLWMRGFNTSLNEDLKLSETKYNDLMKILAMINFEDIDIATNAKLSLQINDLLK